MVIIVVFIIIIIKTIIVLSLLQLHRDTLMLNCFLAQIRYSNGCLNREKLNNFSFSSFWAAIRTLEMYHKKLNISCIFCLCDSNLSSFFFLFFFFHYLAFLHSFSLVKRKPSNLYLLQWENASFLFSVKFYGTNLYNFKSSYFSIHAEYSTITTKNMLKR